MDVDQNPGPRSTWSTSQLVSHDFWGSGVKSSPWNTGRPSFAVAAGWIRLAASGCQKLTGHASDTLGEMDGNRVNNWRDHGHSVNGHGSTIGVPMDSQIWSNILLSLDAA